MKPSFTDRELDVMAILWERGPSTVAEVRERIADDLAHNTVQTVLRILEEKALSATPKKAEPIGSTRASSAKWLVQPPRRASSRNSLADPPSDY